MRPPLRLSEAAWAHPPAAVIRSTSARAGPAGTRSRRTARTAPWARLGGIPRSRLASARAGNESVATISALYSMAARRGQPSRRPQSRDSWRPGRAPRRGAWRGSRSRRLFDRIGRDGRAAALARGLGGRTRRLRRRLDPGLPALARGEDGGVVALDQRADLVAVQHLVLQERLGHPHQGVAVLLHDLLRAVVGAQADRLDLLVDQDGRGLAVVLVLGDLAPQEDLLLFLAEREWAQGLAHAPLAHHPARHLGGLLEVVAGAGRQDA